MEKHTLSHYGWIVILIVILSLLIALATPFGGFVQDSALSVTRSFVNLTYNTLGLEKPLDDGSKYLITSETGTVQVRNIYYLQSTFQDIHDLLFEEWGLSEKNAREYIAYSVFNGNTLESDSTFEAWRTSGITSTDLEYMARDFVVDNSSYTPAVVAEFTNNPNCTTWKQAFINLYYDLSVDYAGVGTARAASQNVTEDDINTVWRSFLSVAGPELIEDLKYFHEDPAVAVYLYIASEVTNSSSLTHPEDIDKDYVYQLCYDFMMPKKFVDIWYNAFDILYYHPDNVHYSDMMFLIDPILSLFTIDEYAAMVEEGTKAEINRAFGFIPTFEAFTFDEFFDYILNVPTLPHSFEIPQEIDGVRMLSITSGSGFRYNENITEIRLPQSIYTIGSNAFSGCGNLEYINLQNITEMGSNAFGNCESLKRIELSGDLGTVPDYCFSGCTSLESVVLNEGITSINNRAFYGCSGLKSVTIPSTITYLSSNPFYYASNKLVIKGNPGSYAETFAKTYGYAFSAL